MRKLASIQKVTAIEPIEGADRIELAHVLGWQCVVNKGQVKPGDDVVYFEVDSFLPVKPEFEFLRSSSYKNSKLLGEGFRLKTMKFRGQISEGLVLPVGIVEKEGWHGLPEGTDVTELLGVREWEIPERATNTGTIIGTLPADIPKTDETRIQAEPGLLQEFAGLDYYITTKMDGSSHSCCIGRDGVFHVTGHNYEYRDDGKSGLYELLKSMEVEGYMRDWMNRRGITALAIQGEYCGEGIQKNRLRLKKPAWYVFTVYIDGRRASLVDTQECCRAVGLDMVPLEEVGTDLPSMYPDTEALLKRAEGQYPNGGAKEGIVIRPIHPVYSKTIGGPLSMKVINNKYLLKNS